MGNAIRGTGLACALALGAAGASAQSIGGQPDHEIESSAIVEPQVHAPRLTFTNTSGGEVTFYGQFNPAFQSFDDGVSTTSGLVDNGNWNSRLGFRITQPLNETTLRLRFETGLGLRSSAAISQEARRPDWVDWQRTSLRWFEAALDTRYGTVSVGQGSTASDGAAGLDDSFTFHAGAADSSDGFSSFRFRDEAGALTDITVGAVNETFDGARRFRIRYDTPSIGGVVLSTSYGRNVLVGSDKRHFYDVALRWSGDLGDFAVQTAASYGLDDDPRGDNQRRAAGSMTVFHIPTGLNLTLSASSRMNGPEHQYVRAGWRRDFFDVGTTSLSVDYYRGRNFVSDGARTENYGLYAVQSFDAVSLDAYIGWRRFTYSDRSGVSYRNADGVLIGARWFF
ncbi:porin [Rhodobaculum claviforme]|uniref:Porin domain-containing protein n=1 Tax=Rhodobaculum claviforme TaxID=1549854 RepID=A0A934TN54_9RHOB|nr:porin [Rhodobaculum claviforme]MBK5928616.1 hypothetical protein [Rhodobaculum claviforme]